MTPYTVLLVHPTDSDETIRRRFHALSAHHHPDRAGARGVPGPLWYDITEAYSAIKTETKRAALEKHGAKLAGRCAVCRGSGVVGSRFAGSKIKVCEVCKGEGRKR